MQFIDASCSFMLHLQQKPNCSLAPAARLPAFVSSHGPCRVCYQHAEAVIVHQQDMYSSFQCVRCPRNILHPKDRAELSKGSISVDAYIRECHPGHQLKHPKLFCVAVLHKPWQDDPDKQQRYKTWPLECCW